ncbi:MAG: hypothetical protein M3O29_08120 [Actinomycetota bacterium]|nr:hypothetical protein [Actinomycetota bacterium]
MTQAPSIGRIVHYKISEQDAVQINKRRADAKNLNAAGVTLASQGLGPQIHIGNGVQAGDVYPAMIVRTWGGTRGSSVQLQVFLDGNDTFWATSVSEGDGERNWQWPPRV